MNFVCFILYIHVCLMLYCTTVRVSKNFTFRLRKTIVLRCERSYKNAVLTLFYLHSVSILFCSVPFSFRSIFTPGSVRTGIVFTCTFRTAAMIYSSYKKQQILHFYFQGLKAPTIAKLLKQESLSCTRAGVDLFLKKYKETGNLNRRIGSGRPSKLTSEINDLVEQRMQEDDETTAHQLHQLLCDRGYSISLKTILRCRNSLGWTY